MRTRVALAGMAIGAAVLPGPAVASAREESPLAAVCSEPGGQTDTPPHPRLRRARVHGVDVAVVLPVGYGRGGRHYPVLYLLHGAQGDEDSWIEYGGLLEDTAAQRRRDRAIVVMPRMGVVTGLAVDWVDGHRQDATFIGRRLVRWTDRSFRTRSDRRHRAIAGYSGGGLSAAHVAERFPRAFGQLGVLSGAVELRNRASQPGAYAAFEVEKVCAGDDPRAAGPLGDPHTHAAAWAAADPLRGAARLRRTTVWLSSGNGVPCTPRDAADLVYPTAATEPQIRRQTVAFSAALSRAHVAHVENRRSCGLHWWTTWRPDLRAFWGVMASAWRR